MTTPEAAFGEMKTLPPPIDGDERLVGAAVIGLPLVGGHYLALRAWTNSSFSEPYRAVFHRRPDGYWTIYTSAPPQNGCGRFWSSAVNRIEEVDIALAWDDPNSLRVTAPDIDLLWTFTVGPSPATRMMTAMSSALPESAWTNGAILGAMGRMAGPFLGIGRVNLEGTLPNGQHYRMAPKKIWMISRSTAILNGQTLGALTKPDTQLRLGEVWLPQRGFFAVGSVRADAFDPTRHKSASALGPTHRSAEDLKSQREAYAPWTPTRLGRRS